MKKTAIILGTVLLFFTASVNAQVDTVSKQPTVTQTETVAKLTTTNSTDKWNNWSADKYKMLPMPEALTTEKIFPVIGHYSVTSKDAAATVATDATATDNTVTSASSDVTITLDETNKGVVWVDGLPQGRIKAYLRKSPSTYMIPAQKTADDKDLAEGVMIFDKDANTLDVCIGCKFNNEDPAAAFTTPEPVVVEQPVVKKSKNKKGTAKAKVKPVKTWRYSGSKTDATASVVPMQ